MHNGLQSVIHAYPCEGFSGHLFIYTSVFVSYMHACVFNGKLGKVKFFVWTPEIFKCLPCLLYF